MSDEDSEKSEEPTSRRLDKAREEGNVPYSQDLGNWVSLFTAAMLFALAAPMLARSLANILKRFLDLAYDIPVNKSAIGHFLLLQFIDVLKVLSLPLAALMFVGVAQKVAQHGIAFSTKPFEMDITKLSPIKGAKKFLTLKQYVEFIKNILKVTLAGVIAYFILKPEVKKLMDMPQLFLGDIMTIMRLLIIKILAAILAAYLIVAIADFAYQRYTYIQQLKMTKHEIKEEYKETEGDPAIKSRIRQIRMERMRTMLSQTVPESDVIITNPTHFAIALQYNMGMPAPKLLAKGQDELALKIREIAAEHKIPIIENPPLARELYAEVDIDQFIPSKFFKAVAEIISFIMQKK